jgi:hypothetical protein
VRCRQCTASSTSLLPLRHAPSSLHRSTRKEICVRTGMDEPASLRQNEPGPMPLIENEIFRGNLPLLFQTAEVVFIHLVLLFPCVLNCFETRVHDSKNPKPYKELRHAFKPKLGMDISCQVANLPCNISSSPKLALHASSPRRLARKRTQAVFVAICSLCGLHMSQFGGLVRCQDPGKGATFFSIISCIGGYLRYVYTDLK